METEYDKIQDILNGNIARKEELLDTLKDIKLANLKKMKILKLSDEEVQFILENEFQRSLECYEEDMIISFKGVYKKRLQKYINEYIKNNSVCVHEKILSTMKTKTNKNDCIRELKKLAGFWFDLLFFPTKEVCVSLINNETISNLLKTIMDTKNIECQNLKEFTNNESIIYLLSYYCNANNKKFKVENIENKDEVFLELETSLLIRNMDDDILAREMLVNKNMELVKKIAKKHLNKTRNYSYEDLVQEGLVGLLRCIDEFPIATGTYLSSYNSRFIEAYVMKAVINNDRMLKMTIPEYKSFSKYLEAYNYLVNNRENPTLENVAKKLNWSILRTKHVSQFQFDIASLNSISDQNEFENSEVVKPAIFDNYMKEEMRKKIQILIEKALLTEKERLVLLAKFKFVESKATLEEISDYLDASPYYVNQINRTALNKLRRVSNIKDLAIYTSNPNKAIDTLKKYKLKRSISVLPKIDFTSAKADTVIEDNITNTKKETIIRSNMVSNNSNEITNEQMLIKILSSEEFKKEITALPKMESLVISLKLGYYVSEKLTSEEIADFLNISKNEVLVILKRAMRPLTEKLNSLLDEILLVTTDNVLTKKL